MGAVNRPGFDFAFQISTRSHMGSSQGDDDDVRQIISSTSCACFELVTSEKNSKDETRVLSVLPTLSFGLLEEIFCKCQICYLSSYHFANVKFQKFAKHFHSW